MNTQSQNPVNSSGLPSDMGGAPNTPLTNESANSIGTLDYSDKGRVVWRRDMEELELSYASLKAHNAALRGALTICANLSAAKATVGHQGQERLDKIHSCARAALQAK
jgi:hypothetical protein